MAGEGVQVFWLPRLLRVPELLSFREFRRLICVIVFRLSSLYTSHSSFLVRVITFLQRRRAMDTAAGLTSGPSDQHTSKAGDRVASYSAGFRWTCWGT